MKHTPGPWIHSPQVMNFAGSLICYIQSESGGSIAQTRGQTTGQEEECLANARLMAASPRLLKTLVAAISWHRAHEAISFMETRAIEEAEALIKEVLGEPMQS